MTLSQIALLNYAVRADGTPANAIATTARGVDKYPQVPGYFSARDGLRSLIKQGHVDQHDASDTHDHNLYSLAGIRPPSKYHFKHERDVGDIYVALKKTCLLERCQSTISQSFYEQLPGQAKIQPDLIFKLSTSTQTFFLEIDEGFEKPSVLKRKMTKYKELQKHIPPFVVIFTFQQVPGRSNWKRRATMMLEQIIQPHGFGKQYVVAPHFFLKDDVLGHHLYTYFDAPHPLSLTDYS